MPRPIRSTVPSPEGCDPAVGAVVLPLPASVVDVRDLLAERGVVHTRPRNIAEFGSPARRSASGSMAGTAIGEIRGGAASIRGETSISTAGLLIFNSQRMANAEGRGSVLDLNQILRNTRLRARGRGRRA